MDSQLDLLLVDDEHLALELLENFAGRTPGLRVAARFQSPVKALEFLAQNRVDLMFLDIEMPQLSGTNLLSVLRDPPATIFTTAYSEFAVDAFALDAVDYLLKPFSYARYLQAVQKARSRISNASPEKASEVLVFRSDGLLHRLPLSEILFVEGMKEYVRITTPKKRFSVYTRLHQIEAQLPDTDFVKVHRSYTVAAAKVNSMQGNRLFVGAHEIPVSRDLKKEIADRLFPNH